MAPISGNVYALPNGFCCWLLFSVIIVGLPRAGNIVNAVGRLGELVPERLNGEWCVAGLTCHVQGGGGVSDNEPPDVERRLVPGGVPIANCTAGGDIDDIISQLLLQCSDLFILMGCERGMTFDMFLGGVCSCVVCFLWICETGFGSDEIGNVLGLGGLACGWCCCCCIGCVRLYLKKIDY